VCLLVCAGASVGVLGEEGAGGGAGLCSDAETVHSQEKAQSCSSSTATSAYTAIQDITSVKIISGKLCEAFRTMRTVCAKHIDECYAEDDAKVMKKSHLEHMKNFLLSIVSGRVPENTLDNCTNDDSENRVEDNIPDSKEVNIPTEEINVEYNTVEIGTTEFVPVEVEATEMLMSETTKKEDITTKSVLTSVTEVSQENITEAFLDDHKIESIYNLDHEVIEPITVDNDVKEVKVISDEEKSKDLQIDDPYYASAIVTVDFPLPDGASSHCHSHFSILPMLAMLFLLC